VFDIAWSELLVVGAVALVVVGPKDFPLMMRKVGHFTRRARMAWEGMKIQIDEAADQAELAEWKRKTQEIADEARRMEPLPPVPDNASLPDTRNEDEK
jgi:sec-independent protein translocase protein TatB